MTRARAKSIALLTIAVVAVLLLWNRPRSPRFEESDCWFETAADVICGYLVVSETRGAWHSAELRLPVVRIEPQAADAPADPILFINGGPGGSAGLDAESISGWIYEIETTPWMRKREMILMDLRGIGLATPSMNCPEMDALDFSTAYETDGDSEAAWNAVDAASSACRDRLLAEGRDFATYNSVTAARDIADLQQALKIEALNIYAASYGTRVALVLMRDHPAGLRSAVLESLVPTDADLLLQQQGGLPRVVEQVAARCNADQACAGRYPDLAGRFAERLQTLDAHPLEIEIIDPVEHKPTTIAVTGTVLQDLLLHALYGSDMLRFMPTFLNRLIVADAAELREWVQADSSSWYAADSIADGAGYGFTCAEQVPFSDWDQVQAEAARYPAYNGDSVIGSLDFSICDTWPIAAADQRERQPVASAVPTLLLSGELDPITPPSFAARAAAHLTAAFDVVLPNAGHAPLGHSPCANEIAEAFLDRPTSRPEAECLADTPKAAPIAGAAPQ